MTTHRIGFWRDKSAIAYAIQTQTRSIYNHCGLITPQGTVIEATFPRTRERAFSRWEPCDTFVIDGAVQDQWLTVESFMRGEARLKTPYDIRGVLRFVSKVPHRENGKWFCSELVFYACQLAGIQLLDRIGAEQVSPGHLVTSPLLLPASWNP
jgi:hypothetical protein